MHGKRGWLKGLISGMIIELKVIKLTCRILKAITNLTKNPEFASADFQVFCDVGSPILANMNYHYIYVDAGGNKRMDNNEEILWSGIRPIEPTKW